MVKQNNLAQFDIPTFFQSGALLQTSPDQFKLISGPFTVLELNEPELQAHIHENQTLVYQPDFWQFLSHSPVQMSVYKGSQEITLNRSDLVSLCQKATPIKPKVAWQNVNSSSFKKQFQWSQQKFTEKKLLKTVPIISQNCKTKFTANHLAWVLQNLIQESHFGWAYGFWQEGIGVLGQSPELIINWNAQNNILKTSALAGTLKNTESNEKEILKDEKNQQEHLFVVDDIFDKLKKLFKVEDILKTPTFVLKLKHLLHLKTDFECKNVSFVEAVKAIHELHPTSALGLYPIDRNQMKDFSSLDSQNERKSFAAPFAFFEKNQIHCVASIRSFNFSVNEIHVISGCGVTQNSIYENELAELELKRESVKKMMGIAE